MRRAPRDDRSCGWIETRPAEPPARRFEGDLRVDCAVVGGGFAGLAAARRLAELRPGWRLAVLEAQRCGFGASGRSSGFVVDLAGFIAAMPEAHAGRFVRLSRAGIEELRELVTRHHIACDWDESGFMHAAATAAGENALEALRRWLARRGESFVELDREALEERIGTSFYRAALLLPGSVQIQTAALVQGLARHLPAPVELFEESPVRKIMPGPPHRLIHDRGQVTAERVILTLNAYAPALGYLRRRIFPLHTFGSLSRPVTDAELAALGSAGTWGILAQDRLGSTLRLTADRRLLVRNGLVYSPRFEIGERQLERARQQHRRELLLRFPTLGGLDLEFTWAGAMGASPNLYPFFGRVAPQIVATGGFSGAGIAMGTASGRLLADLLLDQKSALLDDRTSLPRPRWIPPEPLLGAGIRLRLAWMNRRAGTRI